MEKRLTEVGSSVSDCAANDVNRRDFLRVAAAGTTAGVLGSNYGTAVAEPSRASAKSETLVKHLYDSLTPGQKEQVCFDWDYQDPERGLLRTRTANNWRITDPIVNSDFYTGDQRQLIKDIFEGIIQPEWHDRMYQQMQDDAGGFGESQSIAIFGVPGSDRFEYVFTGRHMTLRCDGNTTDHVAFGGPVFYGHDPGSFDEGPDHDGNVFWSQALAANRVYELLDPAQRRQAEVAETPREQAVAFRGANGAFLGVPLSDFSQDQKNEVQKVLQKLVEPYRSTDRDEIAACLSRQGGLDKCHLAFFTDHDIGNDRVWDNWRLEGPSFVWHYRGAPHVHVWVNIADDSNVELNA